MNFENILKNNNIPYTLNSIRGGTIRGEHGILLLGEEEYIEIKHVALSRKIYALGALEASRWLMCKEKGLFSYSDCKF
jgi:4-hydroxy-tetrahydrodipicolinate reductase